jgi:hypothetical protein
MYISDWKTRNANVNVEGKCAESEPLEFLGKVP